mmetsp:Transcript_3928/g.7501  ORF Transcript_3928/g.7501 Transcript_3928/m.7501 type:complete len:162 (+) Transcript_3928:2155-2640(+)
MYPNYSQPGGLYSRLSSWSLSRRMAVRFLRLRITQNAPRTTKKSPPPARARMTGRLNGESTWTCVGGLGDGATDGDSVGDLVVGDVVFVGVFVGDMEGDCDGKVVGASIFDVCDFGGAVVASVGDADCVKGSFGMVAWPAGISEPVLRAKNVKKRYGIMPK